VGVEIFWNFEAENLTRKVMSKPFIDISFDFRTDANGGDPDRTSPTLRRYHEILWSKPLPDGSAFNLDSRSGKGYLYHNSALGEFVLTSDSVIQTYARHKRYAHIISQVPTEEIDEFLLIGYTIGGMMVFPGNKIDGRMTINGARGCNAKIADRFDLTLECIRRYYLGKPSPLYNDIARYGKFFRLFTDFKGYVDFFLLQDLVSDDYSVVNFFSPFVDFEMSPRPEDLDAYKAFRESTTEFVDNRNRRITALSIG
jgi:hypothetical protein